MEILVLLFLVLYGAPFLVSKKGDDKKGNDKKDKKEKSH
jgi:hypothetical protein